MKIGCLLTLLALSVPLQPATNQIVGVWRGDSVCVSNSGACVDEKVTYYIDLVANSAHVVSIRADKIVQGRAVTMGTGEWQYDADHHTLTWETPRQTWLLTVTGESIDGTLTLADKTVVRRVTLKRDHSG